MLVTLHIENIAVIERGDIEFRPGLNVLTGETGAGKSIIIDSLEAALGWRTSRELIRTGADSALVTAEFTADGAEAWCGENDIDLSEGVLILSRRLTSDGRSSCRVNGVPVTAAKLRELALLLIDIHGQGDGQRLNDERYHRRFLDAYGSLEPETEAYRALWNELTAIRREITELRQSEGEKERLSDTLRFQIEEIERIDPQPGEYDEKLARRELLRNSGRLTQAVRDAFSAINGDEDGDSEGALSLIGEAMTSIGRGARYSSDLARVSDMLSELNAAAQDIASELLDLRESFDFSPGELDALESRIEQLGRMRRKYGADEDAVLAYLEECKARLESIETSGQRIAELEERERIVADKAETAAEKLDEHRREAAARLKKDIEKELSDLSMAGARFEVDFGQPGDIGPWGLGDISFFMSANAGERPGRISRVASGGELARIMLAMKTVLARGDSVSAMVFDEIDTGISGVAAQRVAEKLAGLSRTRQVICVTHLGQIAAMADTQFSIAKTTGDGRTYTVVTELDGEGRRQELARLSAGDVITPTSLASAAELLDAAEKYKSAL